MRPFALLFLLYSLNLSSCSSDNFKPGPEFTKAAEDVVNKYQGKLDYTYKFNSSTSNGKYEYVDLKISESQVLNSMDEDFLDIAAGGIAYTFFKPLENTSKFTAINIALKKGETDYSYPTPVQKIKRFDSLQHNFDKALQLYQTEKFEELAAIIFDSTKTQQRQELLNQLKKIQQECGALTQKPSIFGYRFLNKSPGNFLEACYSIYADKKRYRIRLMMELMNSGTRITGIEFPESTF